MDSKTRHVTNNSKSRKHILSIALIETHALACGRFASSQSVLIINKLVALSAAAAAACDEWSDDAKETKT